ncbi:MAG: glutathione S-transferase [Pseudomonas sp.]|uniref:glutathione S-transferase n=1 Tax=Pseudomonas sp. TaxID=306 RepID=UPI0030F00C1F
MKLIGMLDSPYVRRVAICLKVLGLEVPHQSLSVFSTFAEFRRINPVVKAPTLVLDDGQVLMDSSLILQFFDPHSRLWPAEPAARARAFRLTGLALAACEKAVQVVYEHNLRPAEKLYQPWLERVHGQLFAAWAELEKELLAEPLNAQEGALGQAQVSIAVAWSFARLMLPDLVLAADYPTLAAFAETLERLPVFVQTPAV